MTQQEYMNYVIPRIIIDSLNRNLLPSFRIAQSFFEPQFGTSQLAVNAFNLFGIKDNDQWNGKVFNKVTGEYYNSQYTTVSADFRAYDSWDESIIDQGYYLINRWISKYHPEIKRFADLVGNRDYKDCARILKEKCYGTSLDYDKRVTDYIEKYDLAKYDSYTMEQAKAMMKESDGDKMVINVHAGHNPDGKTACGAVGIIKESTEARNVKNLVVSKLKALGHTVYDCTCENGTGQSDVLKKIVAKCNEHKADLDISIHFNSGAADKTGNGSTTGTEVFIYSNTSYAHQYAVTVAKAISSLGYKNRGVKTSTSLYVLKNTQAPAMLVECCFVDDADDCKLYNAESMANAIVLGITGQTVNDSNTVANTQPQGHLYKVQCGAYSLKKNAEDLQNKLKAAGFDSFIVEA